MLYSLRNRLILTFALLLGVSFAVMFVDMYRESEVTIRADNETAALEKMDAYAALINTVIKQIQDFSSVVYNSTVTKDWNIVQSSSKSSASELTLSNVAISQFLTRTLNNYSIIASVALYRTNGLYVGTGGHFTMDSSFKTMNWYKQFYRSGEHWVTSHRDSFEESRLLNLEVISFLIPIGTFDPAQATTVMKVNIKTSYFMDILTRIHLGKHGTIYLLDQSGQPVLTQEMNALNQDEISEMRRSENSQGVHEEKNGKDPMIYVYNKLDLNQWMLVGIVSKSGLLANLIHLKTRILALTLTLFVLSILVAIWFSHGFSKPLSRLAIAMRYVQKGEFSTAENKIPSHIPQRSEVGFVTASFRHMIDQLRHHIKTEFEMNLSRQQAEYRSLLLQINPHFLFNTLEMLNSLIMQQRSDEALDTIDALGKMLRYSLNTSSDLVKLKDEIAYVRYYLTILELRFSDQLQLQFQDDVQSEHLVIVKLLIQPLVENAVKFSTRSRTKAMVTIRIWRESDRIYIRVTDNGGGMEPGITEAIKGDFERSQLHEVLGSSGRRIGLRNVLARCTLYYGEQFDYAIESVLGSGTSVTLILPAQEVAGHV